MALFGYGGRAEAGSDLVRLSEVTFRLPAADLRRVAMFLLARADEIAAGTFVDGGRHLIDSDKTRAVDHPSEDVIVVPPPSDDVRDSSE